MRDIITKFKNNPKIVLGGILIAALALPIIISQVLRQQDTRQRASTAPAISFSFVTNTSNFQIGTEKKVELVMNTNGNDIGSLNFKLLYDPAKIEIINVLFQSPLMEIQKTNTNGVYDITLLNPAAGQVNGSMISVASFYIKGLTEGSFTLKIDPNIKATASTYTTYVPIDNADNIVGNYTVRTQTSPTPVCTTTNKPLTCTCTQDSECASLKCAVADTNYPNLRICVPVQTPTPVVSNTPSETPAPTPVGYCSDINAANGCTCVSNSTCASLFCTPNKVCAPPPTVTPTPTVTITPTSAPTATTGPTATTVPTATIAPGDTGLSFNIKLPGIGKVSGDNQLPKHAVRTISVTIFNNSNQPVGSERTGTLSYNSTTGKFEGLAGLGNTLTTGSYLIKVKFDNTLIKQLPGIISLTSGSTQNISSEISLVSGDMNQDNELTIQDYNSFLACYKSLSSCTNELAKRSDFNDNGSALNDNVDLNILQRGFAVRQGD